MNKHVLQLAILGMLAITLTANPTSLRAQSGDMSVAEKESKPKKPHLVPFHGKVKAVDNAAKTVSVGDRTFQVTSETKISRDDKPALLADGVVDEPVTGAYRTTEDGKMSATTINFGKKAKERTSKVKKDE
jgi:hypothetical protein